MSSHIVEEQTIHRILTHLDDHRHTLWFAHVHRKLQEMGYDLDTTAALDELGTDLLALNYRATNQRYNESNGLMTLYRHRGVHVTELQALKSLQCLMYQCSEGDEPESTLFAWLETYEHSLMRNIIDSIPAYAAAVWG